MAMLGRVEDLAELVNPHSRLGVGLALLRDCLAGRIPGVANELPNLPPGEIRRIAVDGDALYLPSSAREAEADSLHDASVGPAMTGLNRQANENR
jgi:hypothetical protein